MNDNAQPLSFGLVGTTALVTGSAGGTGRAITSALIAAGAVRVYGWDRVLDTSPGVDARIVDLSDTEDVERALRSLEETPEIVVNAAGFYASREGFDVPTDAFKRTLDINLTSPYIIQREIGRRLRESGREGAFVNVSSVAGKHGFPNQADYVASKAGLIGLTRAAALDLAPRITVNGVAPGTVDTPMIAQVIADVAGETGMSIAEQRESFTRSIPTGRMQQPNEIAAAIVFLASRAARSITGEVLNVDGGSTRD